MKTYCIVGASHRGSCFAEAITKDFKDCAKLLAVCDPNRTRALYYKNTINNDINIYSDFDNMLDTEKPDCVIVAMQDRFHAEYIIKALDRGLEVMTEKPMTIDEESCIAIFEAEKRNNKKVVVTFNYRFMPYVAKIKELLMSNIVGKVLAVNFEYLLGKEHGADYFRRWHARMENSGGMFVHKSTHHFDLINWLLSDEPISVSAMASLDYYGPNRKERGDNCRNCAYTKTCEAYIDINQPGFLNEMYAKAEWEDGYIRDNCVFKDDKNIFDNMNAIVRYKKGALLTYGLNLFNPYEGFNMAIIGEKGRLEAHEVMTGLQTMESKQSVRTISFVTGTDDRTTYEFSDSGGTHGGGDDRMYQMLFRGGIEDKLEQFPTSYDGAKSILIGICANKSAQQKQEIQIKPILDKIKEIQL